MLFVHPHVFHLKASRDFKTTFFLLLAYQLKLFVSLAPFGVCLFCDKFLSFFNLIVSSAANLAVFPSL